MLIVYTTGPQCSRCNMLKDAFQKANIAYEEQNMDRQVIMDCLGDTFVMVQSAPLVRDGAAWFMADDFFDASGDLKANWLTVLKGVKPRKGGFTGKAETETKKQACSKIWGDAG
jgi:hypothetical protein